MLAHDQDHSPAAGLCVVKKFCCHLIASLQGSGNSISGNSRSGEGGGRGIGHITSSCRQLAALCLGGGKK